MRVLGDLAKIAITCPFGHFWSRFFRQNVLQSFYFKRILNEDNAICARELLGEGYFSVDFLKMSLGPPFALFQKMRVFSDLAKIAITWPFGHFWSHIFAPKSSPVFAL